MGGSENPSLPPTANGICVPGFEVHKSFLAPVVPMSDVVGVDGFVVMGVGVTHSVLSGRSVLHDPGMDVLAVAPTIVAVEISGLRQIDTWLWFQPEFMSSIVECHDVIWPPL